MAFLKTNAHDLLLHVKIYSKADSLPHIKIDSKWGRVSLDKLGSDGHWFLLVAVRFELDQGLLTTSQSEELFA